MLVDEDTYIPPFGAAVRYVCEWRKVHTYLRLGAIPPFGGWCEVCMLVEEDTYVPPFGGYTSVWGLV